MSILSDCQVSFKRLREVVFWPLLFACSPLFLRRKIAHYIQQQTDMYATEVMAMTSHILKYLPETDLSQAAQELRLVQLIDKSDVFFSTFHFNSSLKKRIQMGRLPALGSGALILCAHRGNGWWTLPVLNQQGEPVHFVSGPLAQPVSLTDHLLMPYHLLRWHAVNTLGGSPLIPMKGASQKIREILSQNGRVIALIDIPPALAKRCSAVAFFGKTAYFPIQSIRHAFDTGAAIYFANADFDEHAFKHCIDFEPADLSGGPEKVAARYANWLETHIRLRPGSWHSWGHVDAFFAPPTDDFTPNGEVTDTSLTRVSHP